MSLNASSDTLVIGHICYLIFYQIHNLVINDLAFKFTLTKTDSSAVTTSGTGRAVPQNYSSGSGLLIISSQMPTVSTTAHVG